MTPAAPGPGNPRTKTPLPPLPTRAPRPTVARLRRSVAAAAVLGAAALVAGALAWAFVVKPELRAHASAARPTASRSDPAGAVRPSEAVTDGPASYARLDRLPPPRHLGDRPDRADMARSAGRSPRPAAAQPVRSTASEAAAQPRGSPLFFPAAPGRPDPPSGADASPTPRGVVAAARGLAPPASPYLVQAGAIIPAVLLSGVDTARAGPVVAAVSENVYDTVAGAWLLVPQGARLIGRAEGESRHGDHRAFITWTRLVLPNGKSLTLGGEAAVDAEGAVGVRGRVGRRLGPLAIATLFAGAITTLGQAARDHDGRGGGLLGDAGDATAIEAAQVGGRLLERELDVRPSIRLQPGARVRVLVTHDLVLEPYAP